MKVNLVLNNPFVTDSRSWKIARSLVEAGHEVAILARTREDLPAREERDGFTILRVDRPLILRWLPAASLSGSGPARPGLRGRVGHVVQETFGRLAQVVRYLLVNRAWVRAWSRVAPAADIWQSEGLVTLPLTIGLARRHGGLAVYDSRDVHVESGRFARLPGPWRSILRARERRWVRQCAAMITVSDVYADALERTLRVRADAIVMNCPPLWTPPDPRPRWFHERLGLAPEVRVVLYLGQVAPGRGVEELVQAIGLVERAVLVVAGWGGLYDAIRERTVDGPEADRVHFLPGVSPEEIPLVTASADVSAMPVHGTTLNHRLNTPTKLFDAMGAGTPIIASDLPAMGAIVRDTGAGVLCDPADPADIARAIREIVDAPEERRRELREAGLRAARERYNWESQAEILLRLYESLLAGRTSPGGPGPRADTPG